MVFSEGTAHVVESLFREQLEAAFHGSLIFDPIRVELTQNMRDEDAFRVTIVYDGDRSLLDPARVNRISSVLSDRLAELGIANTNTVIESYVTREEDSRRKELEEV